MTELDARNWELDGLNLRDAGFSVLDTDGLEDTADLEVESSDNWGDGSVTGLNRLGSRQVTLTLAANAERVSEADMNLLRQVLSPRTNRISKRTARFRHHGVTKTFEYVPAPGRSLTVPGDYDYLTYGFSKTVRVTLLAPDPVLYSDAVEVESYTGAFQNRTLTNAGSLAAIGRGSASLGALSWTITADGAVTWPYVQHREFQGEFWYLAEVLADGDVVEVGPDRETTVNGETVRATVKGPGGCPIPIWPVLRPGDNTIRVGCFSGSIDATVTARSTW